MNYFGPHLSLFYFSVDSEVEWGQGVRDAFSNILWQVGVHQSHIHSSSSRVTNDPGLSGLRVFLRCRTFSTKPGTFPGKAAWLVTKLATQEDYISQSPLPLDETIWLRSSWKWGSIQSLMLTVLFFLICMLGSKNLQDGGDSLVEPVSLHHPWEDSPTIYIRCEENSK